MRITTGAIITLESNIIIMIDKNLLKIGKFSSNLSIHFYSCVEGVQIIYIDDISSINRKLGQNCC